MCTNLIESWYIIYQTMHCVHSLSLSVYPNIAKWFYNVQILCDEHEIKRRKATAAAATIDESMSFNLNMFVFVVVLGYIKLKMKTHFDIGSFGWLSLSISVLSHTHGITLIAMLRYDREYLCDSIRNPIEWVIRT